MAENGNRFEEFIRRFFIKYGKLQIDGFHGKPGGRANRSVSPSRRQQFAFPSHIDYTNRNNGQNASNFSGIQEEHSRAEAESTLTDRRPPLEEEDKLEEHVEKIYTERKNSIEETKEENKEDIFIVEGGAVQDKADSSEVIQANSSEAM